MTKKLLSRSAFARLCGVSPAAVTKACKTGKLTGAMVNDRIDANHPEAVAYRNTPRDAPNRGSHRSELPPADDASTPDPAPPLAPSLPALPPGTPDFAGEPPAEPGTDIGAYADLTLRELVDKFGTERSFKDWLEALKKIEDIREKRLNNEEYQKSLISRELVKTHVFGSLEAANRRLLTDTPKTLARRLYALAKAGAPIEEAETLIRDNVSSHLDAARAHVVNVLRSSE